MTKNKLSKIFARFEKIGYCRQVSKMLAKFDFSHYLGEVEFTFYSNQVDDNSIGWWKTPAPVQIGDCKVELYGDHHPETWNQRDWAKFIETAVAEITHDRSNVTFYIKGVSIYYYAQGGKKRCYCRLSYDPEKGHFYNIWALYGGKDVGSWLRHDDLCGIDINWKYESYPINIPIEKWASKFFTSSEFVRVFLAKRPETLTKDALSLFTHI